MGNPCNDGPATAAPLPKKIDQDSIKITGNIPPEFRKTLEEFRKQQPSVERTTVSFHGNRREQYAKEPPRKHEPQKVGERRHPDCANWTANAGFNKTTPPNTIDWNTPIPMGMGDHPYAHPNAIIPRVFRFTVETDLNTKFQYFVQDLEIDWANKNIKMTLYETTEFDVDDVMRAYSSEKCDRPLKVMLYDGCGNKIMGYIFHGVACHTYSSKLDYAKSDPLSPKAVLHYKSIERLKRPAK